MQLVIGGTSADQDPDRESARRPPGVAANGPGPFPGAHDARNRASAATEVAAATCFQNLMTALLPSPGVGREAASRCTTCCCIRAHSIVFSGSTNPEHEEEDLMRHGQSAGGLPAGDQETAARARARGGDAGRSSRHALPGRGRGGDGGGGRPGPFQHLGLGPGEPCVARPAGRCCRLLSRTRWPCGCGLTTLGEVAGSHAHATQRFGRAGQRRTAKQAVVARMAARRSALAEKLADRGLEPPLRRGGCWRSSALLGAG